MGLLLLLGVGLMLLGGGGKKKGPPPVELVVPIDPRDTERVRDEARIDGSRDTYTDTAAQATPGQDTAEDIGPNSASTARLSDPPYHPMELPITRPVILGPEAAAMDDSGQRMATGTATYQVSPLPGIAVAKKSAQATADHVRSKGAKYDRSKLAAWQSAAGLPADGLYGPVTVAALKKLGAKNVVANIFKGAKK